MLTDFTEHTHHKHEITHTRTQLAHTSLATKHTVLGTPLTLQITTPPDSAHLDNAVCDLGPGDNAQLALGQAQLVGGEAAHGCSPLQLPHSCHQVPEPVGCEDGQVYQAHRVPGRQPLAQGVHVEQHLCRGRVFRSMDLLGELMGALSCAVRSLSLSACRKCLRYMVARDKVRLARW